MNLHEFETKRLFADQGIRVPKGRVAISPDEANAIATDLGGTVAVKAQVLTGGRGKAGGIALANSPEKAEAIAARILGMKIKGHIVKQILVEVASQIEQEIYLAALIDRNTQRIMLIASAEGGMDVEKIAATNPDKIKGVYADPLIGLHQYQGLQLAKAIGMNRTLWRSFSLLTSKLFRTLTVHDAEPGRNQSANSGQYWQAYCFGWQNGH